MCEKTKDISLGKYSTVLAHGEHGLVLYNPTDNLVVKLIYSHTGTDASTESEYHKRVYDSTTQYLKVYSNVHIHVAKPCGYRSTKLAWKGQEYKGGYIMSLIEPLPGRAGLVHLVPGHNTSSRGCEDIQEVLGSTDINTSDITSCDQVAQYMGILLGIAIFGAELVPRDVDFVLSYNAGAMVVTMLDFGLCTSMKLYGYRSDQERTERLSGYIRMILEQVTRYDPSFYQQLRQGVLDAAQFFIPNKADKIQDSLRYIIQEFSSQNTSITTSPRNSLYAAQPMTFNIHDLTMQNDLFRQILVTNKYSQLVLMSLKPGQEIGEETHHNVDQFIRIESGDGKAVLEGVPSTISDGSAILIPAGTLHNIINTSRKKYMKLYTIYSPPEH